MSNWYLNDDAVDAHYARDYYGPGTDYFDPPEHDGHDSGWFDFTYSGDVGDFIANVLGTFDNEATFTVRKIEHKEEE